jgi:sugar fermentation stimulation protein A
MRVAISRDAATFFAGCPALAVRTSAGHKRRMRFSSPLVEARLIRRYKRFLADVEFADGALATVHCANPGAMTGLAEPGMRVLLSRSQNLTRKLAWSWELVDTGETLVGINTLHPNRLVAEAFAAGLIPELDGYRRVAREVRYGTRSRVDFVLSGDALPDAYIEVKNVHLSRQKGLAEFPDSPTLRGTKHLRELAEVARSGRRAVMLYLIQRADTFSFTLARAIDPAYSVAFDAARSAGVEVLAYACRLTEEEIRVGDPLPVAD